MSDKPLHYNWYLEKLTTETWAYIQSLFSQEEISKIIEIGKNEKTSSVMFPGSIGNGQLVDSKVRSCNIAWVRSDVESNQWIFQRLTNAIQEINKKFFNFDLTEIETLQFTEYNETNNDFYGKHVDILYQSLGLRKLSFSIQLSDPESYNGGDLLLYTDNKPIFTRRGLGDIVFFPSYIMHEVTPVTKGTRYSLVGWVKGPQFK